MSVTTSAFDDIAVQRWAAGVSPTLARLLVVLAVTAAAVAGLLTSGGDGSAHAVAQAGPELTRLLRAMAGLKALMAAGVLAAVLWRLGAAASLPWLAGYVLAGAVMAAGPGMMFSMVHVVSGSLLLHAGLIVTLVMLWRDPVMGRRLNEAVLQRRARLAVRQG